MIITFEEDKVLRVYDDISQLKMCIEPLCVEETIVEAFDEYAQPFKIQWIRPNQQSRGVFGLFRILTNGEYELVPFGERDPDKLKRLITDSKIIEPKKYSELIQDIASHLTTRSS